MEIYEFEDVSGLLENVSANWVWVVQRAIRKNNMSVKTYDSVT